MAAYYPARPSEKEEEEMKQFMSRFSRVYPCDDCAHHMRKWLVENVMKGDC